MSIGKFDTARSVLRGKGRGGCNCSCLQVSPPLHTLLQFQFGLEASSNFRENGTKRKTIKIKNRASIP